MDPVSSSPLRQEGTSAKHWYNIDLHVLAIAIMSIGIQYVIHFMVISSYMYL